MNDIAEALRERTRDAIRGYDPGLSPGYITEMADAVLAVLPSRETVAPTEEQVARAVAASFGVGWHDRGANGEGREWSEICTELAHDLLANRALFPGESREAKP